ncbi:hypothetical protein BT96DRAFT_1088744 [Gymnopus androsaceus JB14]|uniref:Uncharacterized protein n=1 Tax=Gymnopus androsaceus JB14 TaxID=1447944 RepID=A0A6A4GJN4_9AGAR|nr:hypothetical protein BT96DRAFT_1088744 [Gymnopus androsaceus JB14]
MSYVPILLPRAFLQPPVSSSLLNRSDCDHDEHVILLEFNASTLLKYPGCLVPVVYMLVIYTLSNKYSLFPHPWSVPLTSQKCAWYREYEKKAALDKLLQMEIQEEQLGGEFMQ